METPCPTWGYRGVLMFVALALAACAAEPHKPTVAETQAQIYDEDMTDYCTSGRSRDEDGKPDEECGRFFHEKAEKEQQRERAEKARPWKILGAALGGFSQGSPPPVAAPTRCTSTPDGLGGMVTQCN